MMDTAELEAAPREGTIQTQAIGNVGSRLRIVAIRTNIPDVQLSTRFTNMKNCLSHRRTQSRLKSFTNANKVEICTAVESSESKKIMKKW